jgi:hypothetical protein
MRWSPRVATVWRQWGQGGVQRLWGGRRGRQPAAARSRWQGGYGRRGARRPRSRSRAQRSRGLAEADAARTPGGRSAAVLVVGGAAAASQPRALRSTSSQGSPANWSERVAGSRSSTPSFIIGGCSACAGTAARCDTVLLVSVTRAVLPLRLLRRAWTWRLWRRSARRTPPRPRPRTPPPRRPPPRLRSALKHALLVKLWIPVLCEAERAVWAAAAGPSA